MNLTAHDIIIRPIITEKSSSLMELNKYTFEVHRSANKIQIRKAKRMGMNRGYARSWKKAIVSLPEGQRIEFFEGASV